MFRNARTASACARCYKRKKRCDLKYPSCTQCTKARVQCIGLDRDSQAELPRSLLTYLQNLVDQLELDKHNSSTNLENNDAGVSLVQETPQQGGFSAGYPILRRSPLACALAASMAQGTASKGTQSSQENPLPYYRSFFMGAELPYPLAFQTQRSINLAHNASNSSDPTNLPGEVVEKLMAVYSERILPHYPLFLKDEIFDLLQSFKNGSATEHEQFVVLMMQAITTVSSKSRDYRKSVSLAESLRRDAFSCLNFGSDFTKSTTATIQKLLLLAQYGFLLPSAINLWQVVGDAMKIALELGLHMDTPTQAGVDDKVIEFRNRLFWTLYSIERSVAIASHRPYAVSGDDIHVIFPHLEQEQALHDSSRVRFIDRLQFLRLQAEVCSVNIGMRPIPVSGFSYEDWLSSTEQRILEIKAQAIVSQERDFMEWQSLLLLHMPCRRNPAPNDSSVLSYFQAAVSTANAYGELAQLQDIENPWHATHHCYEAGNLILYSLWHYAPLIRDNYTVKQIFEVVHQISGFFILIAKQWPAAQQCGALFDDLRKGALSVFREEDPSDVEGNLEAKKLKDLVLRENADFLYARDQCNHTEDPMLALPDFELEDISPLGFTSDLEYLDFFNFPETPALEGLGNVFMEEVPQEMDLPQAPEVLPVLDVPVPEFSTSDNIDEAQFRVALSKLPVCSHCKKRRIKCDVDLPACRNCTKLHRECFFWDSALSQETSRKRIQVLKEEVEGLMKERNPSGSRGLTSDPTSSIIHPPSIAMNISASNTFASSLLVTPMTKESSPADMLFFGTTSAFPRLAAASDSSLLLETGPSSGGHGNQRLGDTLLESLALSIAKPIPKEAADDCASLYFHIVELVCPILGQDLVRATVDSVYDIPSEANDREIARIRFYLMLSISSALMGFQDTRLRGASVAYFREAVSSGIVNDAFVRPSNTSLQLVLLLCVYVWIRSEVLDIWRLIGHASRMCLDMVEVHGSDKTESATTGRLYRTLYTMESQLAIAFGRPRHLPDGTDFPASSPGSEETSEGELSALVYDLARLQNRFHKDMIKRETDLFGFLITDSSLSDLTWMTACIYDIRGWLDRWNAQVDSYLANRHASVQETISTCPLKLWGLFQQCQSLLFAKAATDRRGQVIISTEQALDTCKQLLNSAKCLLNQDYYGQTSDPSAALPSFPITWSGIHGIFNAMTILMQQNHASSSMEHATMRGLLDDGLKILELAGETGMHRVPELHTYLKSMC